MRNRNVPATRQNVQQRSSRREVARLQQDIDQMFQDFLAPMAGSDNILEPESAMNFMPQVDVEESNTHYLMNFDLPGMSPDDIQIDIQDHQLVVSGERREERTDQKTKRATERFYGFFQRAFTLPPNTDTSTIEADYQNGVLTLVIPKTESARQNVVSIGAKRGGLLEKLRQTVSRSPEQQERKKTEEKKAA